MDEFLFISMAKLGADRLKEERTKRAAAAEMGAEAPKVVREPGRSPTAGVAGQPTVAASRLATFSLAFALGLAALATGLGIVAALERVPAGEVVVSEVDASFVSGEFTLARNQTPLRNVR